MPIKYEHLGFLLALVTIVFLIVSTVAYWVEIEYQSEMNIRCSDSDTTHILLNYDMWCRFPDGSAGWADIKEDQNKYLSNPFN